MKLKKIWFILSLFTFMVSYAHGEQDSSISVDDLLADIGQKSDLSKKTKLENAGVSFIYTRKDLERLQVKYLKDILKTTYPFGYKENIFALPDPMTYGTRNPPYLSSTMRVFIDNQEVTTGVYGSGLVVLGDLDIGFVDHIEIYINNPTYEFSTEPTFTLIKLYTKVAQKDEGGKVEFNYDNLDANRISGYYSKYLGDWSYFTYLSKDDIKCKKYTNDTTILSRDKKTTHLLASLYDDKQKILLQAIRAKKDAFINDSLDATPIDSKMDIDFLHLGYDTKINNLSLLLSYDFIAIDTYFTDNVPLPLIYSQDTQTTSSVYNAELKYDHITSNNKLVLGIKYRHKTFEYDKLEINNSSFPIPEFDTQTVSTIFFENQYSIKENSIFTAGASYSKVKNNNSIQENDLYSYRLGHTYLNNNWIFKTIGSFMQTALDPILVNMYGTYISPGKKNSQKIYSLTENIIYEQENNKYELILNHMLLKDYLALITDPTDPNLGLLDNYDKNITIDRALFQWTHKYNDIDKLSLLTAYTYTKNMPLIGRQKAYFALLRNINSFDRFDIFNEIIYHRTDTSKINYYNYNVGIKYHHTKDLSFSLKGENLFGKAKETTYTLIDPATFLPKTPLKISPLDKKVLFSIEYLF